MMSFGHFVIGLEEEEEDLNREREEVCADFFDFLIGGIACDAEKVVEFRVGHLRAEKSRKTPFFLFRSGTILNTKKRSLSLSFLVCLTRMHSRLSVLLLVVDVFLVIVLLCFVVIFVARPRRAMFARLVIDHRRGSVEVRSRRGVEHGLRRQQTFQSLQTPERVKGKDESLAYLKSRGITEEVQRREFNVELNEQVSRVMRLHVGHSLIADAFHRI